MSLDFARTLVKLKEVKRETSVRDRKESSAEHTWGCMALADYFLLETKTKINRERVMDLLLYHDLVEIDSGDVYFMDEEKIKNKHKNEEMAVKSLKIKLSQKQFVKFKKMFEEFEAMITIEAKFANAIDKLEPAVHLLDYKKDWRKYGFTEEKLREKKEKFFVDFPDVLKFWNELIEYLKMKEYIDT